MRPPFEHDDLAGFAKPARTRRTGGAAGYAADDENTFFFAAFMNLNLLIK
jgi:hypothetical protein